MSSDILEENFLLLTNNYSVKLSKDLNDENGFCNLCFFFIVCNVGCIAFNAICGVDHRLLMNKATDYHFSKIYKIQ